MQCEFILLNSSSMTLHSLCHRHSNQLSRSTGSGIKAANEVSTALFLPYSCERSKMGYEFLKFLTPHTTYNIIYIMNYEYGISPLASSSCSRKAYAFPLNTTQRYKHRRPQPGCARSRTVGDEPVCHARVQNF